MNAPASIPSTLAVNHFCFESNKVRAITDENGEPWFVASDVCGALGVNNVTMALERIPRIHIRLNPIEGNKGVRNVNTIDEPGLYRLILRSDKPQAEPFMEWVTSEVLPTIRRTGRYETPDLPTPTAKPFGRPYSDAWRQFEYKPDLLIWVHTDAQGKPWFKARDVINALGYVGGFHTYRWIYSNLETIEVTTRGGDDSKTETFVSASNLKRIVWRSGKEERLLFLGWVRDVLFPAVGLSWLEVDKDAMPRAVPVGNPVSRPVGMTLEDLFRDQMKDSRFLVSFGSRGEMVMEEVVGYKIGVKFNGVPDERMGMDTFFRRAELPRSVIAELPRV